MRDRSVCYSSGRPFELMADAIMYRWSVERDVWVSSTEVEQARAYLARVGINTIELPDGRFTAAGSAAEALDAARLVLLGLRHLQAARRTSARD
jgi:hypothetical protein